MAPLTYGLVEGENPRRLHRLSAMSGRTQCGKPIVRLPSRPSGIEMCEHCTLMDKATGRIEV